MAEGSLGRNLGVEKKKKKKKKKCDLSKAV
jgi:hypothetical protein